MGVWTLAMWMDDPGSLSSGNSRLLMIFVGLATVAMVVQAIIVIVMAIGAFRTQKKIMELVTELHSKAMPVIRSAEEVLLDTLPKVKVITENLVETSHLVRTKAQQLDMTLTDANLRAHAQVVRVDGMVSTALSRTAALAEMIHEGVRIPVRQAAGLVNGLKAGLEVFIGKVQGPSR